MKGNEKGWKISHLRRSYMVWWDIKRQQSHRNHTPGYNKRKTSVFIVPCSCSVAALVFHGPHFIITSVVPTATQCGHFE